MISNRVKIDELHEYSKRYSELATRVFEVTAEGTILGDFFVEPETRTLAWDGDLDFRKIGHEALGELPNAVWAGSPPREGLLVAVALFLRSGELIQGVLGEEIGYEEHARLIAHAEEVTAVRYDVVKDAGQEPGDEFDYAFTAENPLFAGEEGRAEIAVQLPSERNWTPKLVRWILEHHREKTFLAEVVDSESAAGNLNYIR